MCHLTALVGQPLGEEILCDRDTVESLSCAPFAIVWGCLGRVQHPHLGIRPHYETHLLHLTFTVHPAAPTTLDPLPGTSTRPPHTTSPAPGTSTGTVVSHPWLLLAGLGTQLVYFHLLGHPHLVKSTPGMYVCPVGHGEKVAPPSL